MYQTGMENILINYMGYIKLVGKTSTSILEDNSNLLEQALMEGKYMYTT